MTMLAYSYLVCFCLLLGFLFPPFQFASAEENNYVREACKVTLYPDLCIQLLAPFSNIAKRSPTKWAQAGVSVTMREVKKVQATLESIKRSDRMKGRDKMALSDCIIYLFPDTFDALDRSLGVLRRLTRSNFRYEMADVQSAIGGAGTNEYTCIDGFEDRTSRDIELLRNQVSRVSHITSNALALVNKLASIGFEGGITDPYNF